MIDSSSSGSIAVSLNLLTIAWLVQMGVYQIGDWNALHAWNESEGLLREWIGLMVEGIGPMRRDWAHA